MSAKAPKKPRAPRVAKPKAASIPPPLYTDQPPAEIIPATNILPIDAPPADKPAKQSDIPPEPPMTPEAGEKTPEFQAWLKLYHPNDRRIRH